MKNPTPAQVRKARGEMTQVEAAKLVYTGRRTWQQWELAEAKMHPAFWDLFQRKLKERK